jgi:hypothetical protein
MKTIEKSQGPAQLQTGPLELCLLQFELPLRHHDLQGFRGAFAELAGRDKDLFHNHGPDGYLQRYPLVQYRVHEGLASVLGIGEGAQALQKLAGEDALRHFRMGGRAHALHLCRQDLLLLNLAELQPMPGQMRRYRLYRYLPLDPANYQRYKQQPDLCHKARMLEQLLRNHLVAMLRGLGADPRQPIELHLEDIDRVKKLDVLGQPMMAFDLVMRCNLDLPDALALGRKVAFGFGFLIGLED